MLASLAAVVLLQLAGVESRPSLVRPDCTAVRPDAPPPGMRELCSAEESLRRAVSVAGPEQRVAWQAAAAQYTRAADLVQAMPDRIYALEKLAELYGPERLNDPETLERSLRALAMADVGTPLPLIRLATFLEGRGRMDAAEQTLFGARQQHPDSLPLLQEMTRYFARRVMTLTRDSDREQRQEAGSAETQPTVGFRPQCREAAIRPGSSLADLCRADAEMELAARGGVTSPPAGDKAILRRDPEARKRHLSAAADYYRRAASGLRETEQKIYAYEALAQLYERPNLNRPQEAEPVARELIALSPYEPGPIIRLAFIQEALKMTLQAEMTLMGALQQFPEDVEVLKAFSRFYAALATGVSMSRSRTEQASEVPPPPGHPDENGFYMVGGEIRPPTASEKLSPNFPEDARAVGIQGVVVLELWIDETGRVANARVIRGIPILEDVALATVRQWRFEPAVVGGRRVPVRMIVTQNFTLTR